MYGSFAATTTTYKSKDLDYEINTEWDLLHFFRCYMILVQLDVPYILLYKIHGQKKILWK